MDKKSAPAGARLTAPKTSRRGPIVYSGRGGSGLSPRYDSSARVAGQVGAASPTAGFVQLAITRGSCFRKEQRRVVLAPPARCPQKAGDSTLQRSGFCSPERLPVPWAGYRQRFVACRIVGEGAARGSIPPFGGKARLALYIFKCLYYSKPSYSCQGFGQIHWSLALKLP